MEKTLFVAESVCVKSASYKITGTLARRKNGNLYFDFTTSDGKRLGSIRRKEVFDALSKGSGALNNLVCKRFNLLEKGDATEIRTPSVWLNVVQNKRSVLKKNATDRYGAISLNSKGGKKNTNKIDATAHRLDKYAILVMLNLIERAPQKEDETEAIKVFAHDKADPNAAVITMKDFAEMARRIYGRNDKEKRRMVFDKIRSIAFSEFTADIPAYYHLDNKQVRQKKTISVYGTMFSYTYCTPAGEPDDGDAHEMRLYLAPLFYYLAHRFYAKINIRNLEEVARKKGGGIILRAALSAACNQPERVMHYKHGGDNYTLKISYSSIFGNYKDALMQDRYNRRKEITDEVLADIKSITAADDVNKYDDGITISFGAPK